MTAAWVTGGIVSEVEGGGVTERGEDRLAGDRGWK
jgi:hypothetical protein